MCNKGNPDTVQNTSQNTLQNTESSGNSTTQQFGNVSGQQAGTQSNVLGPTPETLSLYMQLLNQAQGVANPGNFDPNTLVQVAPWTGALDQAINAQYALGQQGMGFVPEAAAMIGAGGQSTIGQIPGLAETLLSPWAQQAVDFGLSQGKAVGNWATDQAQNIMSQGPQLQQFSKAAIEQYESPYTEKVVDATQDWFNNQNAIQGNQLIGQGIKQGNAFGGDRAGVAQGILAGQQQLAQAPVIAGLYNQGYAQALAEFNTQNQLAAQLQQFGANLGLQGLTTQGQLGMQGLGLGLNAATAANQQAISALGQNQNAALQAGQLFGNLGATQYQTNLAAGQQAINAASAYPAYLQNLLNQSAANASTIAAYPFQSTSWYGGLLGGLGPLTGSQSAGSNASITEQQQSQIANMISNMIATQTGTQTGTQTTTPPQPNQWLQAAGLGLAGLGLFFNDGGSVPRMAGGGGVGPYGGKSVPYSERGRSYIQDSGLRPGRLKEPPNPSERPLTPQALGRMLSFMNLGNPPALRFAPLSSGGGRGASSSSGSSNSTLGQISSLLNSAGAKEVGSKLSSFFTNKGDTAASSTSVSADEELKRGGMVNRFADGGWDDDEVDERYQFQEGSPGGLPVQAEDLPESDPWAEAFDFMKMPPGNDIPMPRARPDEAGPRADSDPGLERSEYANYFDSLAAPTTADQSQGDMEGGSPAGLPEQAGLGDEGAPAFGEGRGGGRGRGRMLMPGTPRPQPGLMQRWAESPLTQIGLGLASQNSPHLLGGIGQGLARAMPQIQRQQAINQQQEALDRRYQVDNSGLTQTIKFADGRLWDTGLPTPKALQVVQKQQTQRYGRVPTGYRQTATGEYEPVPGGPAAKSAPTSGPTIVPETAAPAPEQQTASAEPAKPFAYFTAESENAPPEVKQAGLLRTPVAGVNSAVLAEADKRYPGMGETIKAISEGRRQMPAISRNPNEYSQALIGFLHQYDKNIDGTVFPMRQRTANEFAVGMAGKNLVAVNTLGTHMLELHTLSSEMKESGYPSYNALKNAVSRQGFANEKQQALLGRYDIAQKAIADEGAKVFAGQQSALADREEWVKQLAPTNSEAVIKEKLQQLSKLVGGRVQSLADQYNRGMRAKYTEKDFMSPETKHAYDTIMGYEGPSGLGGKGKKTPAETGAAPMAPTETGPAKGTRKQFKQGWGVWDGSKWVPE
jgi:hypothetical protein